MDTENHFSSSCVTHYRKYFKSVQFIVTQRPNLKVIWKRCCCLPGSGVSELTGVDEREPDSPEPFWSCPSAEKGAIEGGEKGHPPCHPPGVATAALLLIVSQFTDC